MPNWCQNVATINHEDSEKIDNIENELKKDKDDSGLFQILRPRPSDQEENWYDWNINNWGTKWEASIYDFERIDANSIKINFDTAWGPCTTLYEFMETEGYSVEAFYNEEGMAFCGQFVDGYDDQYNYSDMDSTQMQEEIPSEIDDMFGLSERKQEWESENEEDDTVDFFNEEEVECFSCGELHLESELPEMSGQLICPSCGEGWVMADMRDDDEEDEEPNWELMYGFTEWFTKKDKPAYVGLYQVKTKEWPWPIKAEWNGKKWNIAETVTEWRGLAVDPAQKEKDLMEALEELKKEFDELMIKQENE
jgi:formylmethanofuran dehydrogenase subunit E